MLPFLRASGARGSSPVGSERSRSKVVCLLTIVPFPYSLFLRFSEGQFAFQKSQDIFDFRGSQAVLARTISMHVQTL
jgi:hypothetical protein